MSFNDLFHPVRGPAALVRLAFYAFVLVIACGALQTILGRLTGADLLVGLITLVLLSPLAYLIREARAHHPERQRSRRGAERTPLMPPNEEEP